MQTWMFRVLTFMAVVTAGSVGFGFASYDAEALPLPAASASVTASNIIVETGPWRRQWRRQGYGPVVVVPDAGVTVDTDVEIDVDEGAPAVIVLPPPRPASCGQYRYWNGQRCVDARYHDPYLGPR